MIDNQKESINVKNTELKKNQSNKQSQREQEGLNLSDDNHHHIMNDQQNEDDDSEQLLNKPIEFQQTKILAPLSNQNVQLPKYCQMMRGFQI
ncbi:unnamed protein product (macronuclear) [Paramecium tetraurelia]|uniref:Uncharacterized protein n=1 Tax=Paramecium tetraurelia TaxID=5888 RepID=A0CEK8_PARTE|nr:uncharacterized protein GSPATT00037663001 [Paramecium tetraurelia]CAK69225.1 unnamed protein product [Paramecium tetraurelia]|eukprot:XP_001436622.1 hypothetical protein (macronuclear) [Paramecium tetraurelia strain d4-2]